MWKLLSLVSAAALVSCAMDEPQPAELESALTESEAAAFDDGYPLAASDCFVDDCEFVVEQTLAPISVVDEEPNEPEQWLARCRAACRGGVDAILAFCATIPDWRLSAICRDFSSPVRPIA